MEYQQALIIGRRRRSDAAMVLIIHVTQRVTEVCAVKARKARDWFHLFPFR